MRLHFLFVPWIVLGCGSTPSSQPCPGNADASGPVCLLSAPNNCYVSCAGGGFGWTDSNGNNHNCTEELLCASGDQCVSDNHYPGVCQ